MAAPYRANHQHKVKAPTSEASKRSAERTLIGASLLSGAERKRRIAELQSDTKLISKHKTAPLILYPYTK
jgi:hypothetical protein